MAKQTARNWSSGDIVTAANLKSIERGVSAVAEEYTPTTWANGDTVTATALNNIEQGIANSGGGSSDFSTAMVTVINNASGDGYIKGAFTTEEFPACTFYNAHIEPNETKSKNLVLYKGGAVIEIQGTVSSISGNIEEFGPLKYMATGDCTITISGKTPIK